MDLHGWGALATVLLVLETFVFCLIAGVILYFLGRGVTFILRELPRQFALARGYLAQGQAIVVNITNRIAAPFIAMSAGIARARGVWAGVRRLFTL